MLYFKYVYLKNFITKLKQRSQICVKESVMASHWAFVIVILPGLVVLLHTNRVCTVVSALKLLLLWLQWLTTDATFWIVSTYQSTDTGPLGTALIQLLKLNEVLSELIGHSYWRFFFFLLLVFELEILHSLSNESRF